MNIVQENYERRSQRASTTERHQDLSRRLLEAAEAVIEAAGLEELRARSLADAVGCSVGAIYGVFPDMDALVLAVNARTLDAIDEAMRLASAGRNPSLHLRRLADAYLDYAFLNRRRWNALFGHRMAEGHALPAWYEERRAAAFNPIAAPVALLRPDLQGDTCALLARTLFSAVHGMVVLGLEGRITTVTLPVLRQQIRTVVEAIARGLAS